MNKLSISFEMDQEIETKPFQKSPMMRTVVILHSLNQELSLVFMMKTSNCTSDLIHQLSQHGIAVNSNTAFHVHFKRSLLTTTHRRSLERKVNINAFDFDTDKSSDSDLHSVVSAQTLMERPYDLIITKQHFDKRFSAMLQDRNCIDCDYKYRLEFHLKDDAWKTQLELALQNDNLSQFINGINQLNISLAQLEDLYLTHSPSYMYYIQQKQRHKIKISSLSELNITTDFNKHIRCIVIQALERIIASDNVRYLHALFHHCNVFERIDSDASAMISFYLIRALTHQSKQCIKLLLEIWLRDICESFDDHKVFETYMRLFTNDHGKNNNGKCPGEFIEWISAMIEPSMCSQVPRDKTLQLHVNVGRRKRYECTKQVLSKWLCGNIDLVRVIEGLDGYPKGLCM
eukprot:258854_1